MALRHGPTDGLRYKRAKPSGNHQKKRKGPPPGLNTKAGETLLTPALQEKLVKLIGSGQYAEVAARACGVQKSTFYNWLTLGGRGEEPYKALVDAIEISAAEAEARDVLTIGRHSQQHWQAAAWRLERKHPKRWGRSDRLEIANEQDSVVQQRAARMDITRLTPDELATLMALRAKMRVEENRLEENSEERDE